MWYLHSMLIEHVLLSSSHVINNFAFIVNKSPLSHEFSPFVNYHKELNYKEWVEEKVGG